jgi:hypothetical protein
MLVKDSYIRFLNQKGYNPIAVPRNSIRPLSVLLNVEHGQVRKVGTLANYIDGSFNPPAMDATDEYVSWASGKGFDRLQASVGIPFISQFLDRISAGGSSISASLNRSSGVEITFGAVLRDGVDINSLRLLLERSRPTRSPALTRDIDAPGSAYIVTDILKSKEIVLKAYHTREASAAAKVPQAGEASIGSTHDEVEEHSVHRELPLPFAFRAVGFFANEGQFAVDLSNRNLELMGPGADDVGNYVVFSPDALLEFP